MTAALEMKMYLRPLMMRNAFHESDHLKAELI